MTIMHHTEYTTNDMSNAVRVIKSFGLSYTVTEKKPQWYDIRVECPDVETEISLQDALLDAFEIPADVVDDLFAELCSAE